MKRSMQWWGMVILFIIVFPAASAWGAIGAPLDIVEPEEMQVLETSNVWITIQFNFTADEDRKTFYAWMNGKPVGALFHYIESDVAQGVISAGDGLKASVNGPRMNVFRAEVVGPNGKTYRQTLRFQVDCSKNRAPVADAGPNQDAFVKETVILDGGGSGDEDEDPLAYQWSIVTAPKKSKAALSDPSSVTPSFVPDMPGTYVVKLVVDDHKAKSEPKTVAVTVERLKILIDRAVAHPTFDLLRHRGIVDQFDGSQPLGGYHAAVLDANAHSAGELAGNRLLWQALREGKWALVFNVSEDHKQNALTSHLGMVNDGGSTAYLFKRFREGNTPVFRIFEIPYDPDVELTPETHLRYADHLLKTLRESREETPAPLVSATADPPIPDGLINCKWYYSILAGWMQNWSGRHDVDDGRTQGGAQNVNYTFTLFLDNGGNPTGNQQFLLLQVDAQGNPNSSGSTFIATSSDMDKCNEFGWFQDRLTTTVNPFDYFWIWVNNDPTSPNPVTTYSANSTFSVGFNQAQGILGSYTHSNTTSYTLTDWGISCNSSGNYMHWDLHSQNPAAPTSDADYDTKDWFYTWCGKPKRPNDQSLMQTQYHGSVVWRTGVVKNQVAAISVQNSQHLVNTYCGTDMGTTCCLNKGQWYTRPVNYSDTFSLDLGAVVPIEVAAITFSQYPALVGPLGGTIKGNVVLKSPAKADILVGNIASTDTAHAVPRTDRIVIRKGAMDGSFEIDVNAAGIPEDQLFFASMSAFYANDYSRQFQMKAVDGEDLYFPQTAPWIHPDWELWGGTYGASENWVENYQVRYAVSFVDSKGNESTRGPWCDWIGPGETYPFPAVYPNTMPLLVDIPTDASGKAVARKIYRQFFAHYQNADPNAGVTLITTLNDNTTTTYLDNNP